MNDILLSTFSWRIKAIINDMWLCEPMESAPFVVIYSLMIYSADKLSMAWNFATNPAQISL